MAGERHPFGGGMPDWVFVKDDDDTPVFTGGALLQFFNAPVAGTEYTDLTEDADGTVPITALVSEDGTGDFELGSIPLFYGPPDITTMWVSAEGGLRRAIFARDIGDLAGAAALGLDQHSHLQNAHDVTLEILGDVDVGEATARADGSLIAWDDATSKFVLISETGLNPADFVQVIGGSTIRIPDNDTTTAAAIVRIPSGTRTGNTLRVFWNSNTNGSPVWFETFWLDPFGHPRVQANSDGRVPFEIRRKSSAQTAELTRWCNEAGTSLAWVNAQGLIRAPNLSKTATFTKEGSVSAGTGKFVWVNTGTGALALSRIYIYAATAGTGDTVVDVNKNGTTLYPTGKPTLPSGQNSSGIITAAFTILSGDRITVDVDSVGTGLEDLTVQIDFT